MTSFYKHFVCVVLLVLGLSASTRGDAELQNLQASGTTDSITFKGNLVDPNAKFIAEVITNVTFDRGFAFVVYRSQSSKASMADISFGSITESLATNPDKKSKTALFGNKWGDLSVEHYGPQGQGYYQMIRELSVGKSSITFEGNFTETTIYDQNGYHPPFEFKFSQHLQNFQYKYSNSILTFSYGMTTSTNHRFDGANNRVIFGNDETEFSWFPFMVVDDQLVQVFTKYTPNVACDNKIFYKCRSNPKFTYHLLEFSVKTNAANVFWDPKGVIITPPRTDPYATTTSDVSGVGEMTTTTSSEAGPAG